MDVNYEDTRLRLLDVSAQQVGCLQVMLEQLFVSLRADLASVVDDPARAVERTVKVAEQKYRDCLEVYGAAREVALSPERGAGHPDIDGSPGDLFDPCDPAGDAR
jgi:hypothetical protein